MAKLSQYYSEVEQMQMMLQAALSAAEQKAAGIAESIDIDLLPEDYSGQIWKMQAAANQTLVMANIHKFERISKDQMERLFRAYDEGTPGKKIIIDLEHTIADYDTTRTIAQRYNMDWSDIQDYNNIAPSDMVPGMIIHIPVEIDLSIIASKDVPTFGDQQGNKILGQDLTNDLDADETGDLKVLSPELTFKQAIENYLSTLPGTLPFYEDIGFDPKVSDEYTAEEKAAMVQLRAINAISVDPRVKNISVDESEKTGNAQILALTVEAISGETIQVRA